MGAQTDIQTYLEQGKKALAQGQPRESAIAYAHGAQMEPENPMVHLGLAEANLGLGNREVVKMACQRVRELGSEGGVEVSTTLALLDVLEQRYESALQHINDAIENDPSVAYAHALRAYLLRILRQDYDASLARSRAMRLSYGGHFEHCFPAIDPQNEAGTTTTKPAGTSDDTFTGSQQQQQVQASRDIPTWSQPNRVRNQIIRTRFAFSRRPGIITYILITVNVIVYLLSLLFPAIQDYGMQVNGFVMEGQVWRLVTAMFLHADPLHIAVNMLSLFFIGRAVEIYFGPWRYLTIYFLAGIGGDLLFLFTSPPNAAVVGASGAIFGIFGAIGVFYVVNRRALGAYAGNAIGQWLMWLVINAVISFSSPDIAIYGHVGGLIIGLILAYILIPRTRHRRII
ncbi:MAG TPA: rhomboid family intramembrane serine protease [Ktedonobacteraceae bacterium]